VGQVAVPLPPVSVADPLDLLDLAELMTPTETNPSNGTPKGTKRQAGSHDNSQAMLAATSLGALDHNLFKLSTNPKSMGMKPSRTPIPYLMALQPLYLMVLSSVILMMSRVDMQPPTFLPVAVPWVEAWSGIRGLPVQWHSNPPYAFTPSLPFASSSSSIFTSNYGEGDDSSSFASTISNAEGR
jgi:hypothetical protein